MISLEKGNKQLVFDNICYALNTLDLGSAKNTISTTGGIGEVGTIITSNKLDGKTINITGYIIANDENTMQTRKQYLFNMINPLEKFDLIDRSGLKKMTLQASETPKFSTANYLNNNWLAMFSLDCYAANPCWTDVNQKKNNVAMWLSMFHFPLIVPQNEGIVTGLREPKLIATINNNGNLPTGMIIKFIAKGSVTNPWLMDINSRQCIKITKDMVADEVITINTNYGSKDISGQIGTADATNYFSYIDLDNCDFLQLAVGENQFKYDADSGNDNLSIEITYSQSYIGV